jgi:hypothetical protein
LWCEQLSQLNAMRMISLKCDTLRAEVGWILNQEEDLCKSYYREGARWETSTAQANNGFWFWWIDLEPDLKCHVKRWEKKRCYEILEVVSGPTKNESSLDLRQVNCLRWFGRVGWKYICEMREFCNWGDPMSREVVQNRCVTVTMWNWSTIKKFTDYHFINILW